MNDVWHEILSGLFCIVLRKLLNIKKGCGWC